MDYTNYTGTYTPSSGKKSNMWIYIGIGAGTLIVLSFITWLIIREMNKTPTERALESSFWS